MSFWDDLSSSASKIIENSQDEITSSATDWFKTQVLGQKTSAPATTTVQAPASSLPAPAQVVVTAAKNNIFYIAIAAAAVAAFFLFRKGK